jgi:hypothetical protein
MSMELDFHNTFPKCQGSAYCKHDIQVTIPSAQRRREISLLIIKGTMLKLLRHPPVYFVYLYKHVTILCYFLYTGLEFRFLFHQYL